MTTKTVAELEARIKNLEVVQLELLAMFRELLGATKNSSQETAELLKYLKLVANIGDTPKNEPPRVQ